MGEIKIFNKLVRDKIPEIIEKNNAEPKTRILSNEEYIFELKKKLNEEIEEYFTSDNDPEELADIKEVFNSICIEKGHNLEEIERLRAEKEKKRGGFSKKIFLIETREK